MELKLNFRNKLQLRKLRNNYCVKVVPEEVWSGYYDSGSLHPKSPIIEVLSKTLVCPQRLPFFLGFSTLYAQ